MVDVPRRIPVPALPAGAEGQRAPWAEAPAAGGFGILPREVVAPRLPRRAAIERAAGVTENAVVALDSAREDRLPAHVVQVEDPVLEGQGERRQGSARHVEVGEEHSRHAVKALVGKEQSSRITRSKVLGARMGQELVVLEPEAVGQVEVYPRPHGQARAPGDREGVSHVVRRE